MQECNKQDPPPEGPAYCATYQLEAEPSWLGRECVGLHLPGFSLPEPPLGGAVCVDFDNADKKKVFNE